ncbi:hypothetical protein AB691_2438 [Stutzerimonas stutzeri]|nr:hypothetical protein AB691_2438 [Stutzerimonas stutzeri]
MAGFLPGTGPGCLDIPCLLPTLPLCLIPSTVSLALCHF